MTDATEPAGPNAEQAEYWASAGGRNWVEHQQAMDRLMAGVTEALLAEAGPQPGERAVDIGCGAGASALALAPMLAPGGDVLGVDISPPLLALARQRAESAGTANLRFQEADAQTYAFEPGVSDLVVSRFGVMFFSDPTAAFANIRRAMRPGARLCFAAWADFADNPWFHVPRDAAAARFGPPPPTAADEPGPFAFADRERVAGILRTSGFANVEAKVVPVPLAAADTPAGAAGLALKIGSAARMMRANDGTPADESAIADAIAAAFAGYATASGMRIPAAINLFCASNP